MLDNPVEDWKRVVKCQLRYIEEGFVLVSADQLKHIENGSEIKIFMMKNFSKHKNYKFNFNDKIIV